MKKNNKKKDYSIKRFILVFIMMICILVSSCTYWMYAYHHKYGKNYYEDKIISSKIDDYIKVEGNLVYINNINEELKNSFIEKQIDIQKNNIIDMTITKGIYKEILSLKINYILQNNIEEVLTINIDLRNKKEISNEDILNKIEKNYKELAEDIYNNYIKVEDSKKIIDIITDKELTGKELNENKEKYIIRIREKLPEVIKLYIKDNKVYYMVNIDERSKICYYTDKNIGYINKEIGKI